MANKNPSPATRIKKGQVLNPGGRPKGLLTADTIKALMGRFCHLTKNQLADIIQGPDSTMLEIMVAAVMAKAAKDGDYSRLSFLLDRTVGKVKDISEVHQHNYDDEFDQAPKENIIELLRRSNNK